MVLAAGACGSAAPRAWAWIDPRPWISAFAERGRPLIGALWIPGPPPDVVRDPWGRPYLVSEDPDATRRIQYSAGPDGRDDEGTADDVVLLAPKDGQIALYKACAPLAAVAGFGLGALLVLLCERRALRALGPAALPALGAASAAALAFPTIRALELVAPAALPPYPPAALLATAVLGGVVLALALGTFSHDPAAHAPAAHAPAAHAPAAHATPEAPQDPAEAGAQ